MIKIEKYKNSRRWAVWKGKELVAVVCYKKGAQTIKNLLMQANNTRRQSRSANRND